MCPSVQAITFEPLHTEPSFLVYRYIFTISKPLGQSQGHTRKKNNFAYFNILIFCIWLQVINIVKVAHQAEDHIKVKVKISTS